jgi:excisionase family DNA binding protein
MGGVNKMTTLARSRKNARFDRKPAGGGLNQGHIEVKNVANYCMVSTTTVRRWLKNGTLSAIMLPSGQYRISLADFQDFLKRYNIPIKEQVFRQS